LGVRLKTQNFTNNQHELIGAHFCYSEIFFLEYSNQRAKPIPPVTKFHKFFTLLLAHVRPIRFPGIAKNQLISLSQRSNPHTQKMRLTSFSLLLLYFGQSNIAIVIAACMALLSARKEIITCHLHINF